MIKGGSNNIEHTPVICPETAATAKSILETVVSSGTGVHANIGAVTASGMLSASS